jgi:hypothetical protein
MGHRRLPLEIACLIWMPAIAGNVASRAVAGAKTDQSLVGLQFGETSEGGADRWGDKSHAH